MKTTESKLYVIELDDEERHWLAELVDNRVHELGRLLVGSIGDDREAWLKEIDIAERVNEEGCLQVVVPERSLIESRDADIHALYAPVVEALLECKREFRMLDKVDINTTHWGDLVDMIGSALAAIKEVKG